MYIYIYVERQTDRQTEQYYTNMTSLCRVQLE